SPPAPRCTCTASTTSRRRRRRPRRSSRLPAVTRRGSSPSACSGGAWPRRRGAARPRALLAAGYAGVLFAVGLLGASLLAAAILPVTAAYVVAETFGFEKGIKHRPREAPVFVGVITALIAIGTIVAIIPGIPVITLLVGVQVVNGVLLPITLFFVWRLASNRKLMGDYANGRTFNI